MKSFMLAAAMVATVGLMSYGWTVSSYYSVPPAPVLTPPVTTYGFNSTPYSEEEMKRRWRAAEEIQEARMEVWKADIERRRAAAAKSWIRDSESSALFWGSLTALAATAGYTFIRYLDGEK